MIRSFIRRTRTLLLVPVCLAVWVLAGTAALAQTPECDGRVYPCTVAGTLLVVGKPALVVLSFGSGGTGGYGGGIFISDPQNPGFLATGVPLQAVGPRLPAFSGTFSLATVSGQATISGASASITCGVTGAAAYSLTVSTPGGPIVLSCPTVGAPGTAMTVSGQISFAALSSLTLTLNLAGTANTSSDTLTVSNFSAQAQIPSPGCTSTVSPSGQAFGPAGGSGTINVTTSSGCAWGVFNLPSWATVTSAASGTGNGTATYQVSPNTGPARSTTITVTNVSFNVEQEAASIPGLTAVGSLAQVASEGTWDFSLDAVNLGTEPAQARFNFTGNDGSPLVIPMNFPKVPQSAGTLLGSTIDRTINSNAQLVIESTGPDTAAQLIGWGQLSAVGNIGGFGIFSNPTQHWNAVVPIETRNAAKYVLAFDNTGALATGVAVANIGAVAANITVNIRDDTGTPISPAAISLAAHGHDSFMLNAKYPITANRRGTIEFDTPPGGQISVLGLRANGGALTTLPLLASTDAPGGAIAHTTYNGGFTSFFYLVNTGTTSANFTLSFFDESGNPLPVPLSLPQSGTMTTTSALTRPLAAGAMLVVETQANDAAQSIVGSAQLTSTGNVSGFEIFRWTTFGQEASVPLETRTPNSFVLVFDNTNGLTTGVALANVAGSAANVTLNIYGDTGAQLQTAAVNLSAQGHTSFLLPDADRYPVTANRRGKVEFVVPPGGNINAVGLRAKADGTLTTIPMLVK